MAGGNRDSEVQGLKGVAVADDLLPQGFLVPRLQREAPSLPSPFWLCALPRLGGRARAEGCGSWKALGQGLG